MANTICLSFCAFSARHMLKIASVLFLSATVHAQPALTIQTQQLTLGIERVATGLVHPWSVAFLPDGRYLVSERRGQLKLIDRNGNTRDLAGMPDVSQHGQGGLLDIALHPAFGDGEHDWIYFTWSKPDGSNTRTALSRAKWQGDSLGDVEHLFEQDRASSPGRHYGSRLAWLHDGTLLMSIGDRGRDPTRAQARDDHAGSTLRLTDTGGVPDDNPFVDDASTRDEIYTLGNRNIQGMTVLANGELWASEHGPRTGDELNHLIAGENYGWPRVSRGNDYATNQPIGVNHLPGMRDPAYIFQGRFAPSGLAEVTGTSFPEWRGSLLAGGLASQQLVRLTLGNDQNVDKIITSEVVLNGELGRLRDIRQAPGGALYLLTDATSATLYRLKRISP
ncbi:PQQ-dependent sugar dehydrogenase [Halomonas sp. LS-001]